MIVENYTLQNCNACQHDDAIFSYISDNGVFLTCVCCFNSVGPYKDKERCVYEWNSAYEKVHGRLLLG